MSHLVDPGKEYLPSPESLPDLAQQFGLSVSLAWRSHDHLQAARLSVLLVRLVLRGAPVSEINPPQKQDDRSPRRVREEGRTRPKACRDSPHEADPLVPRLRGTFSAYHQG